MCMRAPSSLPNHFASLSDPCSFPAPNQRHELIDILVMAIGAVICRAEPSRRGPRPALLSQTCPLSGSRLVPLTPLLASGFWPALAPAAAAWCAVGPLGTTQGQVRPGAGVYPHINASRSAHGWPVTSEPGVRPRRTPNPIMERPL
jgi:hypothetical protein